MMHYDSWLNQGIIDNNRYYNRYIDESSLYTERREQRDYEIEQTCDDATTREATATPLTSCDRSSSADIFRLEFAANQWSKLVTNAEGLFNKLIVNNLLPLNEHDQIEQWLCLKQEYEECIGSDETSSLPACHDNTRKSLEIIEEVTETDEKTDESSKRIVKLDKAASSTAPSEMSEDEDDDEVRSDGSSENPDFHEKLDEFMNKLKNQTDRIVETTRCDNSDKLVPRSTLPNHNFIKKNKNINNNNNNNNNNDYVPIIKPIPMRNPNSRRASMLPGSEQSNEVIAYGERLRDCVDKNYSASREIEKLSVDARTNDENPHEIGDYPNPENPDEILKARESSEPRKAIKSLVSRRAKLDAVTKMKIELDATQRRIGELSSLVVMKQRFIDEMNKYSRLRGLARDKLQHRRSKLEEEYYATRCSLAQAENNASSCGATRDGIKSDVQYYKKMAINYEKRLVDIETIKDIAGDSARKVLELESSLNLTKRQMEKLTRQLRAEDERKRKLENELALDEVIIRANEENSRVDEEKSCANECSGSWNNRETAGTRDTDRPMIFSNEETKNLHHVNARISQLDRVLRQKSLNLERMTDTDEKKVLRHEIRNLRDTRECLIDEKCVLREKLEKEHVLTLVEEKKFLECGETIDAIDAMIEHKNEMICGSKDFDVKRTAARPREHLFRQLEKLSHGEMYRLLDDYFRKVLELKHSSRDLEKQNTELEAEVARLARRLETREGEYGSLAETLERMKFEAERRMIETQRKQQEMLHVIFRHIAEETGANGITDNRESRLDRNIEIGRLRRENKMLKGRLADSEASRRTTALTAPTMTRNNGGAPSRIVLKELKKVTPKTIVTRERNKLIIRQTGGLG